MNEIIEQLVQHRSIRKYTDQAIPQEVMMQIIQAIQCSPSWVNGQQYSIVTITDADLRADIAQLAGNQAYIAQSPVFLIFCADFYRTQQACALEGVDFQFDTTDLLTIGATDVGIALGTAVVAAESYGLGTVAIGGVRKSSARLIEKLQLPKGVLPIAGLCIGYPAEQPLLKPRLAPEIVVHENTYTAATEAELQQYNEVVSHYMAQRGTTGNWTTGVANFYENGYPAYKNVEQLLKQQGFLG